MNYDKELIDCLNENRDFLKECFGDVSDEELLELLRKDREEEVKRTNYIEDITNRGFAIIYTERQREWEKAVHDHLRKVTYAIYLDTTLEVMEWLDSGMDCNEAIIMANEKFGHNWVYALDIITRLSKRGVEFYRAYNKDIDDSDEYYLNRILEENEKLKIEKEL